MKINLGCGLDIRDGYLNVDFRPLHKSIFVADLSVFPWQFEDNSATEILMLDFLEHFPYATTYRILMECYRVLAFDGEVVIQVPDALHTCRAVIQEGMYLCNKCGDSMQINGPQSSENLLKCRTCDQSADIISHEAMKRLYGGQDYAGNFHQTCFTEQLLDLQCRSAGLGDPKAEEESHQWANWNFKRRYTKGELW